MKLSLMTLNLFFLIYYRFLMMHDKEELKENYEEMLDVVVASGFEAVDVLSMETEAMGISYVKEQLQKRKLSVSSYMYFAEFGKPGKEFDKELTDGGLQAVDAAKELETKVLMLVPQVRTDLSGCGREEMHETLVRRLSPIATCAKQQGIAAVIEDTPNLQLHLCGSQDLKEVLGQIPDMYMVYDSGNMLLTKENPVEYYQTFQDRVAHIHLKDMRIASSADRRPDVAVDGTPMACAPTGIGMVDFDALCAAIKESGYKGYLTVEFAMDQSNDFVGCLKRSREYFESRL